MFSWYLTSVVSLKTWYSGIVEMKGRTVVRHCRKAARVAYGILQESDTMMRHHSFCIKYT